METKSFEAFTKSIEGRAVTGIASVFGNVDSYGDIVHKGAFKRQINAGLKRVRHLWMHDPSQPPTAVIKELREVPKGELPDEVKEKFPEATGGLEVTREYLDTPRGNEILAGIQAGAIREMSFGYDAKKWDIEVVEDGELKGKTIRNLREVQLWDISDVNWGANDATVAAKADEDIRRMLAMAKQRIEDREMSVLSAGKVRQLREAMEMLEKILLAPDQLEDEERLQALTANVLCRLEIAQRESILFTR